MNQHSARLTDAQDALALALESIEAGGAAAAIVAGDSVRFVVRGDAVPGVRMTESTPFHVASCSKAFTALLFLASGPPLNTPCIDLLPELRFPETWIREQCTFLDLASMRTGLSREGIAEWGFAQHRSAAERIARGEFMSMVAPFRDRFAYSNLSYIALALALERSTGQTLDRLFEQVVASPCGLRDAGFGKPASQYEASPYLSHEGRLQPVSDLSGRNSFGSAGVRLSARDSALWMLAMFDVVNGERAFGCESAIVREALAPHSIQRESDLRLGPSMLGGFYGLGFLVAQWHGRFLVRHSGGGRGFRSAFAMFPQERLGVMMWASSETSSIEPLTLETLARLAGHSVELREPFAKTAAEQHEAQKRLWLQRKQSIRGSASDDIRAGPYINRLSGRVSFAANADALGLKFEDAPVFDGRLRRKSSGVFEVIFDEPAMSRQKNDPIFEVVAGRDGILTTSYWGDLEPVS